jgi:hypothetical protein
MRLLIFGVDGWYNPPLHLNISPLPLNFRRSTVLRSSVCFILLISEAFADKAGLNYKVIFKLTSAGASGLFNKLLIVEKKL